MNAVKITTPTLGNQPADHVADAGNMVVDRAAAEAAMDGPARSLATALGPFRTEEITDAVRALDEALWQYEAFGIEEDGFRAHHAKTQAMIDGLLELPLARDDRLMVVSIYLVASARMAIDNHGINTVQEAIAAFTAHASIESYAALDALAALEEGGLLLPRQAPAPQGPLADLISNWNAAWEAFGESTRGTDTVALGREATDEEEDAYDAARERWVQADLAVKTYQPRDMAELAEIAAFIDKQGCIEAIGQTALTPVLAMIQGMAFNEAMDREAWDRAVAEEQATLSVYRAATDACDAGYTAAFKSRPPRPENLMIYKGGKLAGTIGHEQLDRPPYSEMPDAILAALRQSLAEWSAACDAADAVHGLSALAAAESDAVDAHQAAIDALLAITPPDAAAAVYKFEMINQWRAERTVCFDNVESVQRALHDKDLRWIVEFQRDLAALAGVVPTGADIGPWDAAAFVDAFLGVHTEEAGQNRGGRPAWAKFEGPRYDMWQSLDDWQKKLAMGELDSRASRSKAESIVSQVREFRPEERDFYFDGAVAHVCANAATQELARQLLAEPAALSAGASQ